MSKQKSSSAVGQTVVSAEGFMLPRSSVKSNAATTQKSNHHQHRTVKPSHSAIVGGMLVSSSIDSSIQEQQNVKRDPLVPLVQQSRSTVAAVSADRAPSKSLTNTRHSFDSKIENLICNQNANALPRINELASGVEDGHLITKEAQGGSLRSSVSSSSERAVSTNKEALRLRVKELEQEVQRLSHHAQQAEMSIRNYRGMLSDKSHVTGFKRDVSIQTDSDDANLQQKLQAAQEKLSVLTQEYQNMQSARDELFKERSRLADLARKKEEAQQILVQSLEEKIQLQQKDITQLQKNCTDLAAASLQPSQDLPKHWNCRETYRSKCLVLKKEVRNLRKVYSSQRLEFEGQLADVKKFLSEKFSQLVSNIVRASRSDGAAASVRIKQLIADKSEVEKKAASAVKDASTAKQNLLQAQNTINSVQRELSLRDERDKEQQQSKIDEDNMRKRGEVNSIAVSPMKFTPMKPGPPIQSDASLSPLSPLHNRVTQDLKYKMLVNEQEEQIDKLTHKLEYEKQRGAQILQRLDDATEALSGLEEVHAAELKAVKHVAHVKDLARIAKEREVTIERDRMLLEMKHLRDVHGVLQFSISTAEQSLEEVLPHVVVKLIQGRERRLKLLEHELRSRMKDVEQRSADTCAVNTAHLENFQQKAESNSKAAKEMTEAAVRKIKSILDGTKKTPSKRIDQLMGQAAGSQT